MKKSYGAGLAAHTGPESCTAVASAPWEDAVVLGELGDLSSALVEGTQRQVHSQLIYDVVPEKFREPIIVTS